MCASPIVLILGGGDLASGTALRLYRAGLRVVMTELPQPLAVRRLVCFAEAIYAGETTVEGINARRVKDPTDAMKVLMVLSRGQIPVLVDAQMESVKALHPTIVVDGRMLKGVAQLIPELIKLIIGLGPGFVPGKNCHAAVETNRGHRLGRVLWQGEPEADTGVPEGQPERIMRSPADGTLLAHAAIGEHVVLGQVVAEVAGQPVKAMLTGVLRGLLHADVQVCKGMKLGDVDPRDDPEFCTLVSDKSLAVGGGVLEAILSRSELRANLWG